MFCCRSRECGCKPHYYQEEDNGIVELWGEYRGEDGQAEWFTDKMFADVFRFESGMTPVGFCSIFFIMTTYTVNLGTSSYSTPYVAPIGYLEPIYPGSSRT